MKPSQHRTHERTFGPVKSILNLGNVPPATGSRGLVRERAPQFALVDESRYRSFCEALTVFWETESVVKGLGLYQSRGRPKNYLPVPGFFCSALLHFAIVFFLLQVPFWIFANAASRAEQSRAPEKVYDLKIIKLSDYFPVLELSGPGGQPGKGTRLKEPPARGSKVRAPRIRIISNPPSPDNRRQTIVQIASPPTLKIPREIPLPNVILGPAPTVLQDRAAQYPKIQTPVVPKIEAQTTSTVNKAPPELPKLAVLPPTIPNDWAALPVTSAPPPPAAAQKAQAPESNEIAELPGSGQDTRQLIVLGVEPASPNDLITLPPGQRSGAFSVSEAGGSPGSPGGVAGGAGKGGAGGSGEGGDESTGLGAGSQGGGGGTPATGSATTSATGGEVKRGESGLILPSPAAALVYPLVRPPHPIHKGFVVAAGPAGGGGLRVYGVLRGGRIYTAYLPMPGKSWILQYCARHPAAHNSVDPSTSVEIRLDPPLVPPSAQEQFDFHWPPLAKGKAGEMIVLKGLILEDGSVDTLSVLQGLDSTADQAALIAFGRWKFRPAMQAGKPVEVEILVGIPAQAAGM